MSESEGMEMETVEGGEEQESSDQPASEQQEAPVDDKDTLEDWDPVLKMPRAHLNLLLECIVPTPYFEESKSKELLQELETVIKNVTDCEVIITGNPVDGFGYRIRNPAKPRPGDDVEVIDVLLVVPDYKVKQDEVKNVRELNGRLVFEIERPAGSPVSRDSFADMWSTKEKVDRAIGAALKDKYAYKHTVNLALRFIRKEDPNNERRAEKEFINGCRYIEATDEPTVWTYCEEKQTGFLYRTLAPLQRKCLVMNQILMLEKLDYPSIVTMEQALVIFYECTNLMSHVGECLTLQDMTLTMQLFLHKLLMYAINSSLPAIPFCSPNHSSKLSEDQVQTIRERLATIRKFPFSEILEGHQKLKVLDVIDTQVIDPVVKDGRKLDISAKRSMPEAIIPACHKLVNDLIKRSIESSDKESEVMLMNRAFKICDMCNQMSLEVANDETSTPKALDFDMAFNEIRPLWSSIKLYERILAEYGENGSDLSNLGCLYHSYIHTLPPEERQEMVKKTADIFKKALSTPRENNMPYDSAIDFCTFLCRMEMFNAAVDYLEKEIAKKEDLNRFHEYEMTQLQTVDEDLQKEIEYNPKKTINVINAIYARYLLAQCHLAADRKDAIVPLVQEMLEQCQKIGDANLRILHTNMAGNIYKRANLFDDAIAVFTQAQELQPGGSMADEFLMECQGLKMSLES